MNGANQTTSAISDAGRFAGSPLDETDLAPAQSRWNSVNWMANEVAIDVSVNETRGRTLGRRTPLCCNDDMGDIEDIQRIKYRYLRALDTKHWDDFADTLTDDVIGDYGESLGEEHHFTDRTTLVEFMRNAMPADVITEHRVTHPEIDVDGDEATATWYLQDKVIVPKFDFMLIGAGFYHDRYRRTADGWKISATGYDRTYDASLSTAALNFKVKAGRAVHI
jgi:hypothetical protein